MPLHPSPTSLSRRSAIGALASTGLGLSFAAAASQAATQGATPQTATPATAVLPWLGHPMIGTWQWVTNPVHPSTAIVAEDGAYVEYDPLLGVGIGLWRATAEQTGEAVVTFRQVDRQWGVFAPDALPEAPEFRSDLVFSFVTLRMRIDVDATGNALTATGRITAVDAEGDILYTLDHYAANAERLETKSGS